MNLTDTTIEVFAQHLVLNGMSENTVRAYKADLRGFLEWTGPKRELVQPRSTVEVLTAEYINAHRGEWAPKTTQRKLGTLRVWAEWLGEENFLKHYKAPVAQQTKPHPLPGGLDDVLKMLECANTRTHKALIALCGLAGLRVSEATNACTSWLDPELKGITVRGKGDKERWVPISDAARPYIFDAVVTADLYHEPRLVAIHERKAREAITRIGKRARIARPVASHDLRATFLTAVQQQTGNIRLVQELAGHADINTTATYTAVTTEELAAAAEVIQTS